MTTMTLKALSLAAGLLALAAAPAFAEPVTIRIAYAGIGEGGRPYVGGSVAGVVASERYLERAFEGDPDVKVEWYYLKGAGPAVNEGLANDQIDFAFEGDLPSLTARANGLKTKILLAANSRNNLYVIAPPDSEARSIADLKGKRVAQFRGTSTHLTTEQVLGAQGLSDRDFRFVSMDDATALAAVAAKQVDAAFGKPVFLSLVTKGLAKVVFSTKGDPRAVTSNTMLVREAFEKAHPDLTQKVVRAVVEAARWSSDEANREALFDIWAKSGTPAEVWRADFEGQALAYRNTPLIDDLLVATYRLKAAQVKEFGLVRRNVEVEGWFEPEYLEQALKDLKLETYWQRYDAQGQAVSQ
jgi:sulfonate transport system substrate-binding protein